MISFGTDKIKKMCLGSEDIWRAYLGEDLVFFRGLYPAEDLYPKDALYPEDDPT